MEHEDSRIDEGVRRRAYEIYVARGTADGDDVADWLAAEREVSGRAPAHPADAISYEGTDDVIAYPDDEVDAR